MAWEEREPVEAVIKRQLRPTPVLVIAILHFTLGGLSLFYGLCGLGGQLVMTSNLFPKPPTAPGRPQPLTQEDVQKYIDERVPYSKAMLYGGMIFDLLLSTLMIVAGFGLLQMRNWGRNLSIGYAFLSIAHKLFGLVIFFLLSLPIMREFLDHIPNQGPETAFVVPIMRVIMFITPALQLGYMIYPITVLIIMFLPKVSASFRGEPVGT